VWIPRYIDLGSHWDPTSRNNLELDHCSSRVLHEFGMMIHINADQYDVVDISPRQLQTPISCCAERCVVLLDSNVCNQSRTMQIIDPCADDDRSDTVKTVG